MTHRIQKQILELDIPSRGDSWRFQNEIRDTFNNLVLPRLEKACEELGVGDDTIIKIDSLLLDTGEISPAAMSNEWVSAIERQFKEQIRLIKAHGPSKANKVEVKTNVESDLSLILHYLNLGVLPWWGHQKEKLKVGEVLSQLIQEQPNALLSGLKSKPNQEIAIRRLLGKLNQPEVKKLQKLMGINSPILEQIKPWFTADERSQLATSLKALEIHEFKETLKDATVKTETLLYQWFASIIKQNSRSITILLEKHNQLLNSTLKENKKVRAEAKTLQAIQAAFTQLKKDHLLEEGLLTRQHNQAETEELSSHKNKAGEQQKENTKPGVKVEAQKRKESETTNFSKGQKSKHQAEQDLLQKQKTQDHGKKPGNNADQNSETPDSPITPGYNAEDKVKGKSQPVSAEDAHVFRQLERIREAALKSKNEQETETEAAAAQDKAGNRPEAEVNGTEASNSEGKLAPTESSKTEPGNPKTENVQTPQGKDSPIAVEQPPAVAPAKKSDAPHNPYLLSRIEEVEECYIENAGLILFWPFLSRFFANIGLMENGAFKSHKHQEKAAICLQYLLSDEPSLEEFALPLNKLLCGLPIEHPLTEAEPINEEEMEFCQELLASIISNWGSLKGTSIPGFQGSFLNRQGVLKKQDNGWLLQVEKMTFDMILEQLPWPVSIVKLSWVEQPIYVEW